MVSRSRSFTWRSAHVHLVLATAMITASAAMGQAATSTAVPDAQVESNVLRALASAPELSTQNIQSTAVYGVVTLTGNVQDETLRVRAENLVARANGVKKVVDELTLGASTASVTGQGDVNAQGASSGAPAGEVLQSDGTYAPAPGQADAANQTPSQPGGQQPAMPGAPEYGGGQIANGSPDQQALNQQNGYPPQNDMTQSAPPPPDGSQGYPGGGQYPPPQPMYSQGGAQGYPPYPGDGQRGGRVVTVAAGAPLQIRINRGLRSDHVQPGTPFTGQVMSDVISNGTVAIPRGAVVQGVVGDAEKAGALKGRGELALQITGLTLGGQQYALTSSTWVRNGQDKAAHTVNSGIFGGVIGALFGAAIGGGAGAAVGAGVGAGAGVASSAASPGGNVAVPPETLLNFTLQQPLTLTTVGQGELQRLAYSAGPYPGQPVRYYRGGYGYGAY